MKILTLVIIYAAIPELKIIIITLAKYRNMYSNIVIICNDIMYFKCLIT